MKSQVEKGPGGLQGSDLNVLHTERSVTVYVLTDSELDELGALNRNITIFSSVAAFMGGLWVDLYKDSKLASSVPEATKQALDFAQPLIAIVAMIFAALAFYAWLDSHSRKLKIKTQSRNKSQLAGATRAANDGVD